MALISPTYNNIEQNNDEKLKNIKHVTVDFLAKYVRVLMIEIDTIQKHSILLDILFRKTTHSSCTSSFLALSLQDFITCTQYQDLIMFHDVQDFV